MMCGVSTDKREHESLHIQCIHTQIQLNLESTHTKTYIEDIPFAVDNLILCFFCRERKKNAKLNKQKIKSINDLILHVRNMLEYQ